MLRPDEGFSFLCFNITKSLCRKCLNLDKEYSHLSTLNQDNIYLDFRTKVIPNDTTMICQKVMKTLHFYAIRSMRHYKRALRNDKQDSQWYQHITYLALLKIDLQTELHSSFLFCAVTSLGHNWILPSR